MKKFSASRRRIHKAGAAMVAGSLIPVQTASAARALPSPNEGGPPQVDPPPFDPNAVARSQAATGAVDPKIRGYAQTSSVKQGGTIAFSFSYVNGATGGAKTFPISIIRLGLTDTVYASGSASVATRVVNTTGTLAQGWKTSFTVRVGRNWPSGIYVARVGSGLADAPDVIFVVCAAAPGANSIVVQLPTSTINAYGNYGGQSSYWYNSVPQPAPKVSYDRPQQADGQWLYGFGFDEEYRTRIRDFYLWLEMSGRTVDYVTSYDVHEDATLLKNYQLFVTIGHDEYWSKAMRDNFDAFIASGGNAAILGGNVCLWQIRFEDNGRTQVCYKSSAADPVATPATKTTTWIDVGRPSNNSFGPGYTYGGWIGRVGVADIPFTVQQPEHWVFSGANFTQGATFGATERLLRYEVDGCDYGLDTRGRAVPTGSDGTPLEFRILALAKLVNWDNAQGNAAMGVMTRAGSGGTVFNASTTNWASGLYDCIQAGNPLANAVGRITANVLDHLTPDLFVACPIGSDDDYAYSRVAYYPDDVTPPSPWTTSSTLGFKAFRRAFDAALVPIYRFKAGANRYTARERLSLSAAVPTGGWVAAGVACYAYAATAEDRVPVYRFTITDKQLGSLERYSLSASRRTGEVAQGIAFYAPK